MNSLSNNERFYIPNTLDGIDILTENITSNALLIDGTNFMLADLDAGGHNVKNMANAVALDDAVTLGQLNTALGNYVDLTTNQTIGGTKTFSNQVNFNGATKTNLVATDIPNAGTREWLTTGAQNITGAKTFVNSSNFTGPTFTRGGTDTNINSTNFNVSATTITNLNNGANCNNKKLTNVLDPTTAQDGATKNYVDNAITGLNINNYVLKAGDTMTGNLNMNSTNTIVNVINPSNPQDVSTKNYTDTADNLKVNKSGDTMSGDLSINAVLNLNAGTTNDPNVDPANKTNTYIRFGEAGATSDWAYLRQIGGSNNINLAIDFHDDAGDGKFSLRSIGSATNPDPSPNTFFYSSPTATNINNLLTLNYSNASLDIRATDENQDSILYLSTPYQNGTPNRRKTAIIADGISNWSRANLHFCLNQALTHNDVTITDSRMCIMNSTGNVGIATTNPSEKLDVNGNSKIRGYLDMSLNKIINVANGTTNNDAINFSQLTDLRTYVDTQDASLNTYIDSSLNLLRAYVNTQDINDRSYVDASLNLKVNRAGDTMTDVLTINKNATTSNTSTTDASAFIDLTTGTIYNKYNLTYNGAVEIWLSYTGSGNTNLQNKLIHFNLSANTSVKLKPKQHLNYTSTDSSCNINGTTYFDYAGTPNPPYTSLNLSTSFGLSCSATIGNYTTITYDALSDTDQLTLKSNLGTTANSEFTGIRFLNTNTDAGLIRVETNLPHTDSIMRIYTRVSNAMTLLFDLDSNITAYKPIIRNAWSSGELIQTKIYNQTTNGSGVQQINANSGGTGAYVDWKTISFTTLNTPTDSILVVEVFAPYLYNGTLGDRLTSKIVDTTSSQTVVESGAAYINGGGGGARGLPFLPLTGSYTPTGATKTRSIKISFDNDGDDILYICRILPRGSVITDKNNYTIKVSEYKI